MKTGIFGQQLSLMETLRAESFSAHAQLQTAPFFQALSACQLPLESYVGQLRALSVLHGVLEQALASCAEPRIGTVWNADMKRLSLLQQDLQFFEPRAVADIKEAVDCALEGAQALRLDAAENPLMLLGALYVLEGSCLGAELLKPLYARAFLLEDSEGLVYLGGEGVHVTARWAQFKHDMNRLALSDVEREQVSQAAIALFARIEAIYRALYPFKAESRTYLVTSINPEAGRHPIPADNREVEAALRAADRCWQRFPYYELRYAERGRRFARSDAAWLVTLYPYTPQRINQQLRWLSRVLAGRGMPSLLLQDQLELLVEELGDAIPERRAEYESLALGAAALQAARRKYLDDAEIESIVRAFDQLVGAEWSRRLPQTGALLACAVTDELEGSSKAVDALLLWLTEAGRFPPVWIDAVHDSIARCRVNVEKRLNMNTREG